MAGPVTVVPPTAALAVADRLPHRQLRPLAPAQCRAERAKARSLKEKFKGASREQMASAAAAPGGGFTGSPGGSAYRGAPTGAASSPSGSSYCSPASAASEPRLGAQGNAGAGLRFDGEARPKGRVALPADDGSGGSEERRMHRARSSPGKVGGGSEVEWGMGREQSWEQEHLCCCPGHAL